MVFSRLASLTKTSDNAGKTNPIFFLGLSFSQTLLFPLTWKFILPQSLRLAKSFSFDTLLLRGGSIYNCKFKKLCTNHVIGDTGATA